MNRVVVTGGAGFIGSHLVDALLDLGAEVLVIDNFTLGRSEHLERGSTRESLTVIEGDIRSAADVRTIADFGPDTVFHMAALHFIPYCNAHPQEAMEVNVLGLDTVLRAVRQVPLTAFVFSSSGAIYGFGDDPWPETAPPRPYEIYGLSKWLGENLMARFHQDRPEVRTVVARLFNTYGPRETNPHVLPELMHTLAEGKPIELGNLWPKRDLIFVTDTAAGLMATVAGGRGFEAFNIGTGTATTIQDVVRMIEMLLGRQLEVRVAPGRMRDGDGHLVCDPAEIMAATGWRPAYDLRAGLHRLLAWEGLL